MLLANLDFVVEKLRENSDRPHSTEVLRELQQRLKKRHTSRQIDSKIRSLIGSEDSKTIQDVYRYGSSRIKGLDAGLKLKVQEELKSLKSEEVCIVVSTPRQLRSVSLHPATETSRSTRASTALGERTPTRSASRNDTAQESRAKRKSTIYNERTQSRKMRKAQHREPQAWLSKVAGNEPLSIEVRNRFES